jgi:GNAT superfamily N-acetyltransferase
VAALPLNTHSHQAFFKMHIRTATVSDVDNLAALATQVWLHTYASEGISCAISSYVLSEFCPQRFATLLLEPSTAVIVAEREQNLIGYAKVTVGTACPQATRAKVELATLYVQEPFVGKGVGVALLQRAEQWAQMQAGTSLWLTVNSRNSRAIAFYAKHGYTRLGTTYFELGAARHENLVLAGRCIAVETPSA